MHILMVTPRYLPEMGGIETHVHEVSKRLGNSGHRVTILTTDREGTLPEHEGVSDGVRVQRVRAWPKKTDYYFAPIVYQQVMRTRCDVVHVQGYHTFVAPLGMLAAIRKQVPFVLTFHSGGHSSPLRNALRTPQWRILGPLVRRASRHVGVSRFEAEFFSARMNIPLEQFTVIPNGAQMPCVAEPEPSTDGPLVVSIGRLERYKGHHRILEAFPEILRRVPGARLRILGDGPYKQRLIELADRLDLRQHVTIGGIPPGERGRVAELLRSAALVVLLSEYEAHPVAVMEALALGRRVLVTASSGFIEMVESGMVEAVPPDASASQVAHEVVEQLGKGPTIGAISLPSWDECAVRLAQVYQGVMQ